MYDNIRLSCSFSISAYLKSLSTGTNRLINKFDTAMNGER
jgi:hypothetical protein